MPGDEGIGVRSDIAAATEKVEATAAEAVASMGVVGAARGARPCGQRPMDCECSFNYGIESGRGWVLVGGRQVGDRSAENITSALHCVRSDTPQFRQQHT